MKIQNCIHFSNNKRVKIVKHIKNNLSFYAILYLLIGNVSNELGPSTELLLPNQYKHESTKNKIIKTRFYLDHLCIIYLFIFICALL